jgi:ABC-type glycerol-3-phosphate transport system permease component
MWSNSYMKNLWKLAGKILLISFIFLTIFNVLFPLFTIFIYPFSDERTYPREGHMVFPPELGRNGDIFFYFRQAWRLYNIPKYLINSLLIAVIATFVSILFAAPAAFGFIRYNFYGKRFIYTSFYVFMMMPDLVYANSLYQLYHQWGMLNTYHGIIFVHILRAIPIVMIVLMGIIESIPTTLEEAAYTLGCSKLKTLYKVTLPLALPGLAAASIFAFFRSWEEFVLTKYLGGETTQTIVVLASELLMGQDTHPWRASTVSLIMLVPSFLFIFIIQRYMKAGYMTGGMARTY